MKDIFTPICMLLAPMHCKMVQGRTKKYDIISLQYRYGGASLKYRCRNSLPSQLQTLRSHPRHPYLHRLRLPLYVVWIFVKNFLLMIHCTGSILEVIVRSFLRFLVSLQFITNGIIWKLTGCSKLFLSTGVIVMSAAY